MEVSADQVSPSKRVESQIKEIDGKQEKKKQEVS
jgi:hypothetical protein